MPFSADYVAKLKERALTSHVHRSHQLLGLEIAKILGDDKHKALYIKLVKTHGEALLGIAKDVAARGNVKNKGAYFMRVVAGRPKTAWDDIRQQGETAAKNLFKRKRRLPSKNKGRKRKTSKT